MGRVVEKLTPEAKIERGQRMQAEGRRLEIEGVIEQRVATSEYYNQQTAPLLTRRRYLELAGAGKFPTIKVGSAVLVRRDDFHAWLEREGIARGKRTEGEDVSDVVEDILAAGGERKR